MESDAKTIVAIKFFEEAHLKWNKLIGLLNLAFEQKATAVTESEANRILNWFQENYPIYREQSDFKIYSSTAEGKTVEVDPLFDVVFSGCTYRNILHHYHKRFLPELQEVGPQLRGHLASVRNKKNQITDKKDSESSLNNLTRIMSRFHVAAIQLKKRRKNKTPFQIEDEYDVQDLLYAFLKLEFDDLRKEEYTPSYAGGASRIDAVLKKEKIIIEAKKASDNLTANKIGEQLIIDIAKYSQYPAIEMLVCFVYDPDFVVENSEGLKSDLEKLSTEKLKVIAIISPKGTA